MDPISIGALMTGGISAIGNMFSSVTSANQSAANTQAQIQASEQQQATQNAFTERMSNTAYTRAVADMKNAGLNPGMMFGSGGAASTPSGSSIQAPMPQTQSAGAGIGNAVSQAVNTAVSTATYNKMIQEVANMRSQQALTQAQTETEKKRPDVVEQEAALKKEQTLVTANEAQQRSLEMPVSRVRGLSAEAIESMPPWLRDNAIRAGFIGQKAGDVLGPFVGSAKGILSMLPRTRSGTRTSRNDYTGESETTFSERYGY